MLTTPPLRLRDPNDSDEHDQHTLRPHTYRIPHSPLGCFRIITPIILIGISRCLRGFPSLRFDNQELIQVTVAFIVR